jgi:hypothetical protein
MICVVWWVGTSVLKEPAAFIFRLSYILEMKQHGVPK